MEAQGYGLGLILYTGVFLLVGLPPLWLWTNYLVDGIHQKDTYATSRGPYRLAAFRGCPRISCRLNGGSARFA